MPRRSTAPRRPPSSSTLLGTLGSAEGGAGAPGVYPDGDFTVAQPHGHHLIEFPFASEGDAITEIVRQRFWQFAASFASQALGTPVANNPNLLLLDEENFKDEGGGVVSWDRVYGNIPQTRDVWEEYAYGAQYMYATNGVVKLQEQAFTVPSRVRYEYFHVKDLASWEILLALRIVQLTDSEYTRRGSGDLTLSGAFWISSDPQIVAEDSKLRWWKYPIMYRATRWIAGPTAAFWGAAITL